MSDENMPMEECISRAEEIGRTNGIAAASWTIDGNTSMVSVRGIVKMIDDGDPLLDSVFRTPSLSGEYTGDFTEENLCDAIGIAYETVEPEELSEIANAYNNAASAAFWTEVERLYRQALS